MAIEYKRMLQRSGPYNNFDKTKMLAHEFAVIDSGDPETVEGTAVYVSFKPGEAKRLTTCDDMDREFENRTNKIVDDLTEIVKEVSINADTAANYANEAAKKADKKGQEADKEAKNAKKIAEDLEVRRDSGEFNGPEGKQGPQGPAGPQGIQGVQGIAGKNGINGGTGPQGVKGDIGETGETGPQGPQGIKGDIGPEGARGERGDSGITVPATGLFTLAGDENGNLYAYYGTGGTAPVFEVDDKNNIFYVTPDE